MKRRRVVPRGLAHRDIEAAVARYVAEGSVDTALGFVAALEQAFRHLALHPGSGSPRHGQALDIPGLRSWPVPRHPSLVFYREQPGNVDVWRVLHMRRDIPSWLADPSDD